MLLVAPSGNFILYHLTVIEAMMNCLLKSILSLIHYFLRFHAFYIKKTNAKINLHFVKNILLKELQDNIGKPLSRTRTHSSHSMYEYDVSVYILIQKGINDKLLTF